MSVPFTMGFVRFAESYGLIIDRLIEGRWARTKTTDKTRKRNGAYKFLGDVGFVQNHRTMQDVAVWRPDGPAQRMDRATLHEMERRARDAARRDREHQEHRWADARILAEDMLKRAAWIKHPYLAAKGFPLDCGHVLDGELLIPMRDMKNLRVMNSLQRITESGEKRFLPGGRAKGSILALGNDRPRETWLVEGYATGLSMREALRDLRATYRVVVCFSAGNLTHVAKHIKPPAFVMADHDRSKAGEMAAKETGLPWTMPPDIDMDANDWRQRHGLRALAKLIRDLRAG